MSRLPDPRETMSKHINGDDGFHGETIIPKKNNAKEFNANFDLTKLKPYPNHKFLPMAGSQFADMEESIREYGIQHPIIAWERTDDGGDGEYIILSGHNRHNAALSIGQLRGPVILLRGITDDFAEIIVTEANLRQRGWPDWKHSERAHVIKQNHDARKNQGRRTDLMSEVERLILTSDPGAKNRREDMFNLSPRTVSRYIRIAEKLDPRLLAMLDDGIIAFSIASEYLSFLEEGEQDHLVAAINETGNTPPKISPAMAEKMLADSKEGRLTSRRIADILLFGIRIKPNQAPNSIKLKPATMRRYFTNGENKKEMANIIESALEMYFGAKKGEGE